jgi:hypothetical protein
MATLKQRIKKIFSPSKTNVTLKNRKEGYFRCYWFPKNLLRGIEIIAESISPKYPESIKTKVVAGSKISGMMIRPTL